MQSGLISPAHATVEEAAAGAPRHALPEGAQYATGPEQARLLGQIALAADAGDVVTVLRLASDLRSLHARKHGDFDAFAFDTTAG